ncbi:MAG: F0F1 ATP synthase subunit B [Deltaproteobacteria bacterium]|nr:F0F1 ATP synthase subunit B [Deltaproteobacteria bacterium]
MKIWALLFLAQAWAAPAGSDEHAASIYQIIFPLVNFVIFVYLLKRFALPWARSEMRSRRDDILSAVRDANEGKRRSDEMVRDYQGRLAGLSEEAEQIRKMLRKEGEAEKERLVRDAETLSLRMKADADFLAEQEVKIARHQVRQEIARLAEEAAHKMVQRHLTEADQKTLVEDFMVELSGIR